MNTIKNIIPQPPPNCKILYPKYTDQKTGVQSEYQSTGYFTAEATHYKRQGHEAKATVLLLDCDLVDFLMEEHELSDKQKVDQLDQKKKEMYTGSVEELIQLQNRFLEYLEKVIMEIGVTPSVCSWSGWGVHMLWWIPEEMGWHERTKNRPTDQADYIDFNEIVHRQKDFTQAINKWCGFHFTDAKCKDAGTRLLRPLGSKNQKASKRPIDVKIVDELSTGKRITAEELQQLSTWTNSQLESGRSRSNRPQPQQVDTSSTQPQPQNNEDTNTNDAPSGRFSVQMVPGTFQIHIGDYNYITFQELIDTWDSYLDHPNFRPASGKLQIVSPGSENTIGSAFVHRKLNLQHNCHMYTITSNRNRTHYRCLTSHHGIILDYGRYSLGEKIIKNASNVKKILDAENNEYKWNLRTMECLRDDIELKNEDFIMLAQNLEERYFPDKQIDPKLAQRGLLGACLENPFDPLLQYLESLPKWDPNVDEDLITNLFPHYLKAEDKPIYKIYAKKYLVSAIARAYNWGCKVDTCLVLKGEQGVRKSGFFKTLCGEKFFLDESIDISNKDGKSLLKQGWFIEFAELESMNGKDVKLIKSFLTKQRDVYRPPYGTKEDKIPRRNVFCGTTNEDKFLKDATGSRRFWIVECGGDPNTPVYNESELAANRDKIWAQAIYYYQQGTEWWLTKAEEEISVDHKEKYQVADPHEELLLEWIDANPDRVFTVSDMIQEAYVITEETEYGPKHTSKVLKVKRWHNYYSEILPKLGCTPIGGGKRIRREGKRGRFWQCPSEASEETTPQSPPPPPSSSPPPNTTQDTFKPLPQIAQNSDMPLPRNYAALVKSYEYQGPNVSKVIFHDGTSKTFSDMTKAEKQYWIKKSLPSTPEYQTTSSLHLLGRYDD